MSIATVRPGRVPHPLSRDVSSVPAYASVLGPVPGRMHDFVLGGHDHLPADRTTVRHLMNVAPWYERSVQIAHTHTLRTAALLTNEMGIGQFLDLGSGPRSGRTDSYPCICSVLQDAVVVHVDTPDAGWARTCAADGHHRVVRADITQPLALLRNLVIQGAIDLRRPVGVLTGGVLSRIPDDADALHLMTRLRAWMPPGSAIALTHTTDDFTPASQAAAVAVCLADAGLPHRPRTRDGIARLLASWPLREPGLLPTGAYFTGTGRTPSPDHFSAAYAAIALNPESS
ncbi:SAM-dependent methyltransferase [Streptomyces sp. BE147]|uniref:SAM-dependent methyltransferase n=1 Tax=Streptomyces sp. BE147 TaxID=3002524 RepID=UPI002E79413C|nr:SAM-dependent methyltransferase [Streptomyces sp. BE147]MEE1741163.1 SAM-dependent methyltransferase [Streptomyces sp. BE147]